MLPPTRLVAAGALWSRFLRLDFATVLLIGWSTILFWRTLPAIMAAGLVR